MKKQLVALALCIMFFQLMGQTSQVVYTCPLDGSDFINPDQIIVLKSRTAFKNISNLQKGVYCVSISSIDGSTSSVNIVKL